MKFCKIAFATCWMSVATLLGTVLTASADTPVAPLVIHGVEMGVAKFHRLDHQIHPTAYDSQSVWKPYILPDSATAQNTVMVSNDDGSVTLFFTSLEELIQSAAAASKNAERPIGILNIEAHGMPGGTWFPADPDTRDADECADWRATAFGDDQSNYDEYYSALPKYVIEYYRQYAQAAAHAHQPCVTGLEEWASVLSRNPEFISALANGAQIHFISCLVGLGLTGELFTEGLAQLLFSVSGMNEGQVITSINYGLGDWSMPEGMGFWDYQSDAQLTHDISAYTADHNDREIMQFGMLRSAGQTAGQVASQKFDGFSIFNVDQPIVAAKLSSSQVHDGHEQPQSSYQVPTAKRWAVIPGTRHVVDLSN